MGSEMPDKAQPGRRRIRLIALDLDGTLLDDEKRVPDANREALREAARRGTTIALASGRMTDCIVPTALAVGVDCAIISYNGGMARGRAAEGRPVLFHRPLEARYGRELIEYCRGRHLLNFYHDDVLYAEETAALRRFSEIYATRTGAAYTFVPDLGPFAGCSPTKAVIITDPAERDRLYDEWVARWRGEAHIVRTDPEYLEFLDINANKGVALAGLCEALGLPAAEAMALGDGDNDAEMLRAAGLGVAVANASDRTKAAADVVSRLRYDECAVADAVERYALMG
jgi:Cof subfamily protein (haloacid dehalogenase superfamily)